VGPIGERIRDKFAASRKRGMWMGGNVPLGYRVEARKLVVVEDEARLVQRIFERFATLGSALEVARQLNKAGEVTKRRPRNGQLLGGKPWTKGAIYKILATRDHTAGGGEITPAPRTLTAHRLDRAGEKRQTEGRAHGLPDEHLHATLPASSSQPSLYRTDATDSRAAPAVELAVEFPLFIQHSRKH
jgi:hypothetical protein